MKLPTCDKNHTLQLYRGPCNRASPTHDAHTPTFLPTRSSLESDERGSARQDRNGASLDTLDALHTQDALDRTRVCTRRARAQHDPIGRAQRRARRGARRVLRHTSHSTTTDTHDHDVQRSGDTRAGGARLNGVCSRDACGMLVSARSSASPLRYAQHEARSTATRTQAQLTSCDPLLPHVVSQQAARSPSHAGPTPARAHATKSIGMVSCKSICA